jgi:hypothetical protein
MITASGVTGLIWEIMMKDVVSKERKGDNLVGFGLRSVASPSSYDQPRDLTKVTNVRCQNRFVVSDGDSGLSKSFKRINRRNIFVP